MKDYNRYTSKDGATLTMSQWGGSPAELELYRKLAEIEDKIENGALIELPCKVGDKVWIILNELWTLKPFVDESVAKSVSQIVHWIEFDELGTLVFLTKAEAEAKLLQLKGERK